MKIIATGLWESEDTLTKSLHLNGNQVGDSCAEELYLNPLADCDISVKGFVSDDDINGVELKAVDIANLEKTDAVTKAGNYVFPVGSYYKVIIEVTGTANIIYKLA